MKQILWLETYSYSRRDPRLHWRLHRSEIVAKILIAFDYIIDTHLYSSTASRYFVFSSSNKPSISITKGERENVYCFLTFFMQKVTSYFLIFVMF